MALRLYEYADESSYKDYENYLFSTTKPTFDFAADKVTVDAVEYRISTIGVITTEGEESGTVQTAWVYFPDKTTDGSIRIGKDANGNFAVQKLEAGSWGDVGSGASIIV